MPAEDDDHDPDGGGGGGVVDAPTDPAAILAASDLPPAMHRPVTGDPMGVTIHRLKNG
ncbi:MAG: hypothetical protein R3B09_21670 [Nannocystaceae bacterium]